MKILLLLYAGSFVFSMAFCGSRGGSAQNGQVSQSPADVSGTPVIGSTDASIAATPATSEATLEGKHWRLTSAADGQNKTIDMPTADDRPVVFTFADGTVSIQGPCNQFSGTYTGGNSTPLVFGPMRSTMRACEPAVMTAESKLSAKLAGPLQMTLDGGEAPRIRLVTSANETLAFDGKPTPESLYGPAKIIFMEVGPKRVSCTNPNGERTCLEVRDRFFDEKGLQSAAPSPWRPLFEKIEGYTHVPGQRNVLRVKSFMPSESRNVYVLDIAIETEVVR